MQKDQNILETLSNKTRSISRNISTMERSGKKQRRKGHNRKILNNNRRGMYNKSKVPAGSDFTLEQTRSPSASDVVTPEKSQEVKKKPQPQISKLMVSKEPTMEVKKMPEPVNPSLQSTGSNLKTSSGTTDWRALNLLPWPVLLKELSRKGEQCGDKAPTVTKSPKEAEPDMPAEVPQPDVASEKVPAVLLHEEPKLPLAQQVEETKASDPVGISDHLIGAKTTRDKKLDFNIDSDEEKARLRREQMALFAEVERLKQMLRTKEALQAMEEVAQRNKIRMLQLELAETERAEDEAQQKAKLLEDASAKEEMKQKKVETCPTDQGEESSRLLSGLTQAEEDLNRRRLQWQEEKANLLRYVAEQQAPKQKTHRDCSSDKRDDSEQKEADLEKETKKKSKKPSLWKRFLRLVTVPSNSSSIPDNLTDNTMSLGQAWTMEQWLAL